MKSIVMIVMALVLAGAVQAQTKMKAKVGDKMPKVKCVTMDGKKVSFKKFKGKYIYIDLWNNTCKYCIDEFPALRELEKEFEGKNIVFISVSLERYEKLWRDFVNEKKIGGIHWYLGRIEGTEFHDVFWVYAIPRFILLDREGKILDPKMTRPTNPKTKEYLRKLEGL